MEVITLPNTLHKGRTLLKLDSEGSLDRGHLMIKVKGDSGSSFLLSLDECELLIRIIQIELSTEISLETLGNELEYEVSSNTFNFKGLVIKVEDL